MKRGFLLLKKINVEATIWIIALAALAVFNPYAPGKHFTLCILSHLGFDWCPGCGIGHSISFLLHGDFQSSWEAHFFGLPALLILLNRIFHLLWKNYSNLFISKLKTI